MRLVSPLASRLPRRWGSRFGKINGRLTLPCALCSVQRQVGQDKEEFRLRRSPARLLLACEPQNQVLYCTCHRAEDEGDEGFLFSARRLDAVNFGGRGGPALRGEPGKTITRGAGRNPYLPFLSLRVQRVKWRSWRAQRSLEGLRDEQGLSAWPRTGNVFDAATGALVDSSSPLRPLRRAVGLRRRTAGWAWLGMPAKKASQQPRRAGQQRSKAAPGYAYEYAYVAVRGRSDQSYRYDNRHVKVACASNLKICVC